MIFLIIKDCLVRFIHGSGIDNPLNQPKENLDLTNPLSGVKAKWLDDRVRTSVDGTSFDLMYNDRSEAEIASEFLNCVEELQ